MKFRLQFLALLGTMLAALLGAPTQAHAIAFCAPEVCNPTRTCENDLRATGYYAEGYACNTYVSSLTYYKGWGSIRDGGFCSPALRVNAWVWKGYWVKSYLDAGTQVYIWPFATDWSWVWTAEKGWMAARDVNLVVNKWRDPWAPMPLCATPGGFSYVD